MTEFDNRKLTELVLYILGKTGGIDFYHVFKILYFAEREHLAEWGCGIVPDRFCALKYGPVPTCLYNAVKELGDPRFPLAEALDAAVMLAGEDAPNVLLPKRGAELDYLSQSELEVLDRSIDENKSLTFAQLMQKSHDAAWAEANQKPGTKVMSPAAIAKVLGADPAMIAYIEEQMRLDTALR